VSFLLDSTAAHCGHLIDVLMLVLHGGAHSTAVCPMTFMTANKFLVARYISVPKPCRAQ